jgi:hypothetical protein
MSRDGVGREDRAWAWRILGITAGAIALTWLAVVAVDVLDLFGSRQRLLVDRRSNISLYRHLADNNRPLEWVQWLLLIGGSVCAGLSGGTVWERGDRRAAARLTGLAAFLGVLAVKDAGSPRNVIRGYAAEVGGDRAELLAEVVVFGLVGMFGLLVFVGVWRAASGHRIVRRLLLAGYGAYGLAAGMSITRHAWYEPAGEWVLANVFQGRATQIDRAGWFFMDSLVEETVELIAIGFLVASTAAWLQRIRAEAQPERAQVGSGV